MKNAILTLGGALLFVFLLVYFANSFAEKARNDPTEFEAGRAAALEGMPVQANPIRPSSFYFTAWQKGWQQGFREKTAK